jgi:hypothetical protein
MHRSCGEESGRDARILTSDHSVPKGTLVESHDTHCVAGFFIPMESPDTT